MVNVLVKSTKVPRPATIVPLKKKESLNNKLLTPIVPKEALPDHISYVGSAKMPITSSLKIVTPEDDTPRGVWPVFRMMDENGVLRGGPQSSPIKELSNDRNLDDLRNLLALNHQHFATEIHSSALLHTSAHEYPDMPLHPHNTLLRAHRQMIRLRKMDTILHNAQRQGRISFYMTHHGEEGLLIGSASALSPKDFVFAQYREAGILMWRGFTLDQFCNQCFSNDLDLGKGKQMPVHYGSRALNYQTVSSPLGTQLTQAVGAAYKMKLDAVRNPEKEQAISITYFGDGAASCVDFHSACNFASTLKVPMIFFCRNNGYAISTPVKDQYAGDGIISRAPGYGMSGIRVDGNDIFAVHAAVQAARAYAIETSSPVMIEAMTYRQGHHSTSDDSSRYRDAEEVQNATDVSDPIVRLDLFLRQFNWMDDDIAVSVEDEERIAVLRAMEAAEARPNPKLEHMFEDVYHEKPPHLIKQEEELKQHLKKYNVKN
jgi:2-oxoisovalerate dehydrogenase E1 component alpha subunit